MTYWANGDILVPGDFDVEGNWDVAVIQQATGKWYIKDQFKLTYGNSGDFPLPTFDTNGDGDPYQ
ncbi:MAG: hypothetical protein WBB69_04975 [Anaerolineales bacterium]